MTEDVPATRNAPLALTALLVLLGLACAAAGVVYLAEPAGSLPSFFPGHLAGSAHHHTKHGIGMFVVAVVLWVAAWFSTGTRTTGAHTSGG